MQLAEERISNMRTVRAFGKELSEVNTYTQKTDQVFNLAKKEAVLRAGFYGVVSVKCTHSEISDQVVTLNKAVLKLRLLNGLNL